MSRALLVETDPQLDDVDAAGQGRIGELGQVAEFPAGIGAQVQPRFSEKAGRTFVHIATVAR